MKATPGEVLRRLRTLCSGASHQFWEDGIALFDEKRFRPERIGGPQQVTEAYLLALAVQRGGRLATFDRSVPWRAVVGANAAHLIVLGAGRSRYN